MQKNQYHNSFSDDGNEDSLINAINKRDNQLRLNDYLRDDLKYSQQTKDLGNRHKQNSKSHAGFSTANDFFKPSSKQRNQNYLKKQNDEQYSKKQSLQSTVTVGAKIIRLKERRPNKQLQKPILKDIEDIGSDLDKNCNNCSEKKVVGGLNYKARNKKLVEEYEKKVYALKDQDQGEKQFINSQGHLLQETDRPQADRYHDEKKLSEDQCTNQEKYKQEHEEKKQQKNFKQSLNQFQYSQNKEKTNEIERKLIAQYEEQRRQKANQKFNFIIQNKKISTQQKLKIADQTVYFPYKPYDAQINYMEKVIHSLNKRENAVLESPTGTGKTLCLLSAALSWIQNRFEKQYKQVSIIYLSRTHSQLAQVSKQLEKTCFRPTMATFGSRELFCIKRQFNDLKGREKVEACSKAVKLFLKYGKQQTLANHIDLKFDFQQPDFNTDDAHLQSSGKKISQPTPEDLKKIEQTMCQYYKGQRYVLQTARQKYKNKIITNEKIRRFGQQNGFCPYYYPNFVKPICNLFLMPYNYLLDCELSEKYKSIVRGSILIFDEAHNVPDSSCQGRSFSINKRVLEDALKQLNRISKGYRMSSQLYEVFNDYQGQFSIFQAQIKHLLENINKFVEQIEFPGNQTLNENDSSLKKMFNIHETEQKIYEILYERLNDQQKKIFQNMPGNQQHKNIVDKMIKQIEKTFLKLEQFCLELAQTPDGIFQNMQRVVGFVKRCLYLMSTNWQKQKWVDRSINHFRVYVSKIDKSWEITLACLVPFLTMKQIAKMLPYNIILTSGTMSPIDTWQSQLGIPFPIRFTNTHVISPDQLMLRIVTSHGKQTFNFSYKYLQDNFKTIYRSTLQSIADLVERIPNGVLVVTPSYKIMNNLERALQYAPDIRKKLSNAKTVYTQNKESFQDLIKKFKKAAVQKNGALMFCVCRGKISEGIDFPNQLCRSVIFIGIPFPNITDVLLNEKKSHYTRLSRQVSSFKFSGDKWYQNNTFRSVNQAIGRVIRHINDYGSIFLLDIRYNMEGYKAQLPKWSQKSLKTIELGNDTLKELPNFYRKMKHTFDEIQEKQRNEKHQDQASQDQDASKGQNSKYLKNYGTKEDIKVSKGEDKGRKQELMKEAKLLYSKLHNGQKQKPKQVNLFTMIMGTNQNKKKKPSQGANSYNF